MSTPHTVFQNRRLLNRTRTLIVLLMVIAVSSISQRPNRVAAERVVFDSTILLQPDTAQMLTGTSHVINNGPGEQTDAHVDCDLAPYLNDDNQGSQSIHYFDFATNTDHTISGNGSNYLPDVQGGMITFTESNLSGPVIVLFNTATQTRTLIPGFQKSNSSIGGNLVAFEDRSYSSVPNESEIVVYDQSVNELTLVTSNLLWDKAPEVSPTGNAIVWEGCHTIGVGCDIYSAIRNGPGDYTLRFLTGAPSEDHQPVTNGEVVAYISNQSGENDIYIQRVAGGDQTHLSMPGDQRDLSIAGDFITFSSRIGGQQYDLFAYHIITAKLYRVTNTPVNETLSRINICNGKGRIVYSAPGMDFNVYSFTFPLPGSPENQTEVLIELVESFDLPNGTENSLVTKLQDALAALEASDTATACVQLSSFINECQAQSGKKLTADQAGQLTDSATQIKAELGCQ